MAERGQRTKIALGEIMAEVSLVKTSSEPKGSSWISKTVDVDTGEPVETPAPEVLLGAPAPAGNGSPTLAAALERAAAADPLGPSEPEGKATEPDLRAAGLEPPTRQARGIMRKIDPDVDDSPEVFVELTEQLAAIDARVQIDGIELVAAINARTIPRERIRGASYVVPVDDTGRRVCALLYGALSEGPRGLAVRWTKRTNQALGVIVASQHHGALVLLEVEFAANMKPAPTAARVATEGCSAEERSAALRFVQSLEGRRADLDAVVDERRTLHAELIAKAKAGELETFEIPAEEPDVDAELARMLAGASA